MNLSQHSSPSSSQELTWRPTETGDLQFAVNYPLHILIADDNYINRRVLSLFLKQLGYEADTTENGRECLKAVLDHSYDLLLSDIDMPEMDGIECAKCIREAGFDLPIIAMTATSPDITRKDCFDAGMDGYMTKPIDFAELKHMLQDISMQKLKAVR